MTSDAFTERSFTERHAQLLHDRVKKTFRHYRKRFERQQIGCYRLYDWSIPEVRARVDYYEGHVVVAEYVREQTRQAPDYLDQLGEAARRAVGCAPSEVHLKRRTTRRGGTAKDRYERTGQGGSRMIVRERDARFWVNLDDYIDTGLFSDHRDTRAMVRTEVRGKSVLNLYCYTGAFTVAAALGEATSTMSVDLSPSYLAWAQENLVLNGASGGAHQFVEEDCESFLRRAVASESRWDYIVVDPPSFSTVGAFGEQSAEFDVVEAHPELLRLALRCLSPGGRVLFSTNHQRFHPRFEGLAAEVRELTHRTVPEDFRGRGPFQTAPVHRTFSLLALGPP